MAAGKSNCVGRPLKDLTGQRFTRLVVVELAERGKHPQWLCMCDCGSKKQVPGSSLANGRAKSCGCLKAKLNGLSVKHPGEYISWSRMLSRCVNKKCKEFQWYGAIGRYICQRWRYSFANFIEDMGPSNGLTIERIDNSGNYTCGKCEECREKNQPANCRWATMLEQGRNKSNSHYITHDGKTLILAEWSRLIGIRSAVICGRLKRGWSVARALSVPAAK